MPESAYRRLVGRLSWWQQARGGALVGVVAFAAAVATWLLAVALLQGADPALLFLIYVVALVMLAVFVGAALLTARLAGIERPVQTVVAGTVLSGLVTRLLVTGFGMSVETPPLWAGVAAVSALAFAASAALVAPNPSTPRRVAAGVAAAVALALVPLPSVVADGREVASREAKFAAIDFPLIMVELPGHRVTWATVGSYTPRDLQLLLSPVDTSRVHRITVTVTRTPPGELDCLTLMSLAGEHGRPAHGCRAAGPLQWAFDQVEAPAAVLVHGDAIAVLRVRGGSDVDADDLLAARLRPASARELASIRR